VDALADLLAAAGRWEEQATLFERAAEREAEHVGSIYSRIGDVQREQLGSPVLAARGYASALRIDPGYGPARDGLTELLEDATTRSQAAEALAQAYHATDEWERLLGIVEHRLASAETSSERVALLREAARLQERRGEDRSAALASMRRAMALAPEVRDIEQDVLRLAEDTGEWQIAVAAIRDAVEALGEEAPRARYLRMWEGRIAEEHLGEPATALSAYGIVYRADPSRRDAAQGVIRTSAQVGRWDGVAEVLVAAARGAGGVDADLTTEAEKAAESVGAFEDLVSALASAVREAELPRKVGRDLEVLVARWHRDGLEDLDSAEAALGRAVAHDDAHEETLRALAELQRRAPGLPLHATLARMADLAEDDLDALREAAEVASATDDAELARQTVERLYKEASRHWKRHTQMQGTQDAEGCTRWALDRLVETYEGTDPAKAVALLADAALLPVTEVRSRDLRRP